MSTIKNRLTDKRKAMVLASFAGDSLALGVHWIYDTEELRQNYGRVTSFVDPSPEMYHPNRKKGEFTHYGDQTYVLLESIAERGHFDPEDFSSRWRSFSENYDGYIDQATRSTLRNYTLGKSWRQAGSTSGDLAGVSRIAPLVYRYYEEIDTLVETAKVQTSITHNNPVVIQASEFFARCTYQVLHGTAPVQSMRRTIAEFFADSDLYRMFAEAMRTIEEDTVPAIAKMGQGCDVTDAFPSVVHLIAKYQDNLKEALIECVMAGGDSAARALIVGMVLGAHLGLESIPQEWLSELKAKEKIEELLNRINGKKG